MELSKIMRIVSVTAIMLNMNVSQKIKLENYAKLHQYQWNSERKREEEIENLIKQEASKITKY